LSRGRTAAAPTLQRQIHYALDRGRGGVHPHARRGGDPFRAVSAHGAAGEAGEGLRWRRLRCDAVIIDAVRTPLGKGRPGGALAGVHPVDRLAQPLAALVAMLQTLKERNCSKSRGDRGAFFPGWRQSDG
jgi:hypothetical protein